MKNAGSIRPERKILWDAHAERPKAKKSAAVKIMEPVERAGVTK